MIYSGSDYDRIFKSSGSGSDPFYLRIFRNCLKKKLILNQKVKRLTIWQLTKYLIVFAKHFVEARAGAVATF